MTNEELIRELDEAKNYIEDLESDLEKLQIDYNNLEEKYLKLISEKTGRRY